MSESAPLLPIGKQAFNGIAALVELGNETVRLLESQAKAPLDLSLGNVVEQLAKQLNCDEALLGRAITNGLIPLNGIRRTFEIETELFLTALAETIEARAPEDWKSKHRTGWERIRPFPSVP